MSIPPADFQAELGAITALFPWHKSKTNGLLVRVVLMFAGKEIAFPYTQSTGKTPQRRP